MVFIQDKVVYWLSIGQQRLSGNSGVKIVYVKENGDSRPDFSTLVEFCGGMTNKASSDLTTRYLFGTSSPRRSSISLS